MLKSKKRSATSALKNETHKKLATYSFQIIGLEPSEIEWTVETHIANKQSNVVDRYLRSQLTPGLESMEKTIWRQRSDKMAAYDKLPFVVVVLDTSKHLKGFAQSVSVCSFYQTHVTQKSFQPDTPNGLVELYYGFAPIARINKVSSDISTGGVLEMSALLQTDLFKKKWAALKTVWKRKLKEARDAQASQSRV